MGKLDSNNRGPLRFIILTKTGQDIGKCTACRCCYLDETLAKKLDMPPWAVIAAACKNLEVALTNRTIWALAEASPAAVQCANDLDVVAVGRALCKETRHRGLAPERNCDHQKEGGP